MYRDNMKKPALEPRVVELSLAYVNKLLGMKFTASEVKRLLERMRFGVNVKGDSLVVSVPPYRTDVLHPMDLVEDVAIAYGYMNFKPEEDDIKLRGELSSETKFAGKLRDILTGLGFSETMTLVMTNQRDLFERTLVKAEAVVEAESAVSSEHSVARSWLLPSMLTTLEVNKNNEYPQRFFEVGLCVSGDGLDVEKIAGVIAHAKTNFSEIKSVVLGLYESIRVEHKVKAGEHPSFIEGRCGLTKQGFYGEIHPQVLRNFSLEVPATGFELDVKELMRSRR